MSFDYEQAYEDAVHKLNQAMKALRQIELVLDDERKRYNALLRAVSGNAFMLSHPSVTLMAEPESFKAGQEFGEKKEREACAAICDEMVLYTGLDCAAAIRARGQA